MAAALLATIPQDELTEVLTKAAATQILEQSDQRQQVTAFVLEARQGRPGATNGSTKRC